MLKLKIYLQAWLILSAVCLPVSAQTRIRDYYRETDLSGFRHYALFNEVIDLDHIDNARLDAVIFFLTNEIRVNNHLQPLDYAPQLERSATMHAQDMVQGKFFSHINPDNKEKKTPNDRAKLCQISNPYLAENIIEGYGLQYVSNETVYLRGKGLFSSSPDGELLKPHTYLSLGESFVQRWMNSKDHRKNILAKEALQMGCGIANYTDGEFNDMPSLKAVQNFQWFKPVIPAKQ